MPGRIINGSSSSTPPSKRSSTASSRHAEPTNTLILTSLPLPFFQPSVLNPLRDHFESYGKLHTWAPLRAFARIIIVFWDVDHAERARAECDRLRVGDDGSSYHTLRIYRGEMTSIHSADDATNYLQVPAQTKNFLISPPGSPPIGWEPVVEEPPNTAAMAADLIVALNRLQAEQGHSHSPFNRFREDGKEVLLSTGDGSDGVEIDETGAPGLVVLLEDTDRTTSQSRNGLQTPDEIIEVLSADHEQSPFHSSRPRSSHVTPYPGSIGQVKATVASMRPTSMPPMLR